MNKTTKFVISLAAPLLVGGLGAYLTYPKITGWYALINKPSFNPPNGIFGPVWTVLYIMMGIALYLVWSQKIRPEKRLDRQEGIELFVIQLFLNFLWTWVFFGRTSPGYALIVIAVLWLAIILNIVLFARVNKTAAWLLAPYLAWVSFAAVLNYYVFALNL